MSPANGNVTYYPNATEITSGAFVRVDEGESLSSVDISTHATQTRGFCIRGTAVGDDGGNVQQGQNFTLRNLDGLRITGPRAVVKKDGTFEFSNVMPGRYFVETLFAFATSGGATTVWNDIGRAAVTVTNRDVNDVRIRVSAGHKISGTISGPEQLDKLPRVTLVDLEGAFAGGDASTQANADGSFQLEYVNAGQFNVSVTDLPARAYVKSIHYGDRDVTHTVVDVPAEMRGSLNISLGMNAASVKGSLSRPGNVVALWPKAPDVGQALGGIRVARTGEQGEFLFDHVPPGEYRVIAWEEIEQGVAQYAPFLARFADRAVSLVLEEGLRAEATVPIVSRADSDTALDDLL